MILRTAEQIADDVEAGLRLHGILKYAAESLKTIKERLELDALARPNEHEPLHEVEREGRKWTAPGGLEIILTADALKTEIERNGKEHLAIMEAIAHVVRLDTPGADTATATDLVTMLFERIAQPWNSFVRTESDGLKFRQLVNALLREPHATTVIDAWKSRNAKGIPKSDIKAEWDALTVQRADEAAAKRTEKLLKLAKKAAKEEAAK